MDDSPFSWEVRATSWAALAVLLGGGVALSRGARWLFAVGVPLPRKTERVDLVLPQGLEGDLNDTVDRLYAFELDDYRSAFWLSPTRIGLLYWGVSFGARNTLRIRLLRGVGVLATGIVDIERGEAHTTFHWRPILRLGPLALIAALVATMRLSFGADYDVLPALVLWVVMYLGLLWWTLRQLPGMYDAVSAQLLTRGWDSAPPRDRVATDMNRADDGGNC